MHSIGAQYRPSCLKSVNSEHHGNIGCLTALTDVRNLHIGSLNSIHGHNSEHLGKLGCLTALGNVNTLYIDGMNSVHENHARGVRRRVRPPIRPVFTGVSGHYQSQPTTQPTKWGAK